MKYFTTILLALFLIACSPFRIIDYKTFDNKNLKGVKPAILFVTKQYRITKFDGKAVNFTPTLVGAFGGRHIHMLPGKHSIQFGWGALHRGPSEDDDKLTFSVKENSYYSLTTDMKGVFIVEEKKRPKNIPDSSWNYYDNFK